MMYSSVMLGEFESAHPWSDTFSYRPFALSR